MRPTLNIQYDDYPFGSLMPGRSYNANLYRFGFNGQEMDNEVFNDPSTSYTAEFWQYDSRIGRRWNLDPKPNPAINQYATFANNPIWYSDVLGDTIRIKYKDSNRFLGGIFKSSYTYIPGEEYKGDNEFVSKVVESLNHDRTLDDNKIIDELSSSKKNLRIKEIKNEDNSYTPLTKTVKWNPNKAMGFWEQVNDETFRRVDQSISPSTVLFHELGHSFSHFFDKKNYNRRFYVPLLHWTDREELFNITNYEHSLAKKKGEGLRYNHYGEYFNVSNIFAH